MTESKHTKFKRLAKLRGDRVLKDIQLLGNLSNRNNYDYTDIEIRSIFSTIEEEIKVSKFGFLKNKKRRIKF